MSLISKEHFSMALKSIKKLLGQKADKSDIVQPDWNQNDEIQFDYVKNRTHYEYHEVLWQHTFTESDIQIYNYFSADTSPIDLKRGNTYVVEVNGVSVKCIAYEEYGSGFININTKVGNISVVISNNYSMYNDTRYNARASEMCTVVLKASTPTVHKLDEKFIPDSIARKENIPAAPMMVTTRSIDAGSAFDPSVTVAEMLEALKSGTPVWVQISGTYYPVSAFSSYEILCRKNGTRVYRVTSSDSLFREVNG